MQFLYNPRLTTSDVMIPGLAGVILVFIGTVITSLGVVRERQAGTLEQLAVMPLRPPTCSSARSSPTSWSRSGPGRRRSSASRFRRALPRLAAVFGLGALLFLFVTLGIGVLISSVSQNQGQAIQLAVMTLLPQILLSGLIFPLSSIAAGVRWIAYLLPLTYFIEIARGVMLRAEPITSLWQPFLYLAVLGAVVVTLATLRFRAFSPRAAGDRRGIRRLGRGRRRPVRSPHALDGVSLNACQARSPLSWVATGRARPRCCAAWWGRSRPPAARSPPGCAPHRLPAARLRHLPRPDRPGEPRLPPPPTVYRGSRGAAHGAYLERTGLAAARDRLAGQLPAGCARSSASSRALLHRPRPAGPGRAHDRGGSGEPGRPLVAARQRGGGCAAVVLATTYLDEAERSASVLALDAGRTLAEGTPEAIAGEVPGRINEVAELPRGGAAPGGGARCGGSGRPKPAPARSAPPDFQDAVMVAALRREAAGAAGVGIRP